MNRIRLPFAVMLAFVLSHSPAARAEGAAMQLQSADFQDQADIPALLTCQGRDLSPALSWQGLPPGTRSLVLIVDDPDAPDPAQPRTTWVHWLLYNIPPTAAGLPQGVAAADLPPGTLPGRNDWHRPQYGGPCPPVGRHRYFHKLYALDTVLPDLRQPDKAQLEAAMAGHVIAQAQLVGLYRKH